METGTRELIKAIQRARDSRKMSDREFSKLLGISPSYLSLLKAGKRRITANLAVRFLQRLPEIQCDVLNFVVSQANNHGTHNESQS